MDVVAKLVAKHYVPKLKKREPNTEKRKGNNDDAFEGSHAQAGGAGRKRIREIR